MRVTYDEKASAAYIYLRPVKRGMAVKHVHIEGPDALVDYAATVIADYDAYGDLLGIEIIGTTRPLVEELK